MSNFICPTCGFNNIDCGKDGYKTDREIEIESALNAILTNGPACQNDNDCPLNGGNGYDQGCATCACIIAEKALKGKRHEV